MVDRHSDRGTRRGDDLERPWEEAGAARTAFVVLWATGPDTTLDGVFRILALRPREGGGGWEAFERFCDPFRDTHIDPRGEAPGDPSARAAATARMVREYGVHGSDLDGAPAAREAIEELRAFLGEAPLLTHDADGTRAWLQHFAPSGEPTGTKTGPILGLAELAGLLFPGRPAPPPAPDLSPADLQRAFADLVGRFLSLPPGVLGLAVDAWTWAWRGLVESDPPVAERLAQVLALLEHPTHWALDPSQLFEPHESLVDGRVGSLARGAFFQAPARARDRLAGLEPACARAGRAWLVHDPVPIDTSDEAPFPDEDLRRVDDVFQVHLPALFEQGTAAGSGTYRAGQHEVARRVAETLGRRELLLVHAPTGTGKTLAYLVPALLWSLRHGVRLGVSTYTRALQEQAMASEVPRALGALARAGMEAEPRVSVLKGRPNYLCWRALELASPGDDDGPETWLAWTSLCLFGMTDEQGDLDRFPMRSVFEVASLRASAARWTYRRELESLVRSVRAESACCRAGRDRETCAAEVARLRAERSHVVITNHAFALARQTFFKRVVFDECEHLHEQAHAAFSHSLSLDQVRDFLLRLRQPGRPASFAPLDRLERVVLPDSSASEVLGEVVETWYEALGALDELLRSVEAFKTWRDQARRERNDRDEHSLLREYVGRAEELDGLEPLPEARELFDGHRRLVAAGNSLDGGLARLAEHLDTIPMRGTARLRRTLERARADLAELLEVLRSWLPTDEGRLAFRPETFYDLEQDARGRDVLAARVLLPNEYLGRHYYPQLSCAVMISATTWLRGGFESSAAYLGLDRAAFPDDDEEREPATVRTFRAPDPFDYQRVLVCVPDDAPAYGEGRQAFGDYVRRFVAHLAERTRGRMLVLFTNSADVRRTGEELSGFFRARRLPFWFQNMPGLRKEELGELFRTRVDSVLMGVDTFWYGADFPGETLEYLVIVKLPYGVPDRYHHAQCAALGSEEQRRRIYLPRALGKFRQGFGRLMRRESDRGCVFVLDGRILGGRHREFLRELPLAEAGDAEQEAWRPDGARLVVEDTESCLHAALAHMNMLADVRRRGLDLAFEELRPAAPPRARRRASPRGPQAEQRLSRAPAPAPHVSEGSAGPREAAPRRVELEVPERIEVPEDDLPF